MPKFFIKDEQLEDNKITIIGEDVKHISNVLRMKIGEKIQICNIDTNENYSAELELISKEKVVCNVIEKIKSQAESNINLKIFQGIPKSDKWSLLYKNQQS